eukprot:SAG31_NODE_624_length_13465_cov_11.802708_3_plen_480_part_00
MAVPCAISPAMIMLLMLLLLLFTGSLLGAAGSVPAAVAGDGRGGRGGALPPWLPRNPACLAHGCPLPARRTTSTVDTTKFLHTDNTAAENTAGWKALVKVLAETPGSVVTIPGGTYNVAPLSEASGLINVTIAGGQDTPALFRVHNATGAHVAAWSHSRGLYLRDMQFVAVGVPPCIPGLGECTTTSGLNWYNCSDSIVEGVSMVGGRMMSMSGGCPCPSCTCYNPPINFHFRRCYSSNAPVGIFLCDSWYSSIEDSVAENITGSPGYGIEIKGAAIGNWITGSTARNCKYGFAHGSMNAFVDRSWASNLTAVDCHTAVITSGSNCVWEGVHVHGASTTAAAIECMVNRVGSGRNNTFEVLVRSIISSRWWRGGSHVTLHQGTVGNVVDVLQWPAPSQVLKVAFVAGAILEGHSNGIARSPPTCYGSPSDCGCPTVCPNLTAAERVGSGNVVNVRVRTGSPVCSGDCSRNVVNRLNVTL